MSPINAFVREIATKKLYDSKTDSWYSMKHSNPEVSHYLGSWSNKLAGVSNLPLPKGIEKVLSKATGNLTSAILMGNLRTMLVQPTALLNTYGEFGPGLTMKGVAGMMLRSKKNTTAGCTITMELWF